MTNPAIQPKPALASDPKRIKVVKSSNELVVSGPGFHVSSVAAPTGFLLNYYEGFTPLAAAAPTQDFHREHALRYGPLVTITDASAGTGYAPGTRETWSAFMGQKPYPTREGIVLVTGGIAAMTASIISLASGGTLTQYGDRAAFEHAVRDRYPSVNLALMRRRG